jgi:hypothetical protein
VNALQLVHLLTQSKVKVPEILRQHYPDLDRIASEPPAQPMLFHFVAIFRTPPPSAKKPRLSKSAPIKKDR